MSLLLPSKGLLVIGGAFGLGVILGGGIACMMTLRVLRHSVSAPTMEEQRENTSAIHRSEGVSKDVTTRFREAMALNHQKRWSALRDLINSLTESQFREALENAQLLQGSEKLSFKQQLFTRWAEADPHAALAYAQGLTKLGERNQAVAAAIKGWVQKDQDGAVAWLWQLPSGVMKNVAIQSVIINLEETDPKMAIKLAAAQTRVARGQIESMSLSNWATKDLQGALNYVSQMPESPQKIQTLQSLIDQVAQTNPSCAIGLIDQKLNGSRRDYALQSLASIWGNNDPQAALA